MTDLYLKDLKGGTHELTPSFGASLADAAAVCLDDQGHSSGKLMALGGTYNGAYKLRWRRSSPKAKRTWNDLEVTTEHGAYALAKHF